jgi:dUTP pyrophosphatase
MCKDFKENEEFMTFLSELVDKMVEEKMASFGKDIAIFEKVSLDEFVEDALKHGVDKVDAIAAYEEIQLPMASTTGSAGFDFYTPFPIELEPGESKFIPTGIRCKMKERWALLMMPRSGHGTKFRLQLDNTIGLIDEDYYYADNEGHIMIKLTNDTKENKNFVLASNSKFVQGVFCYTGTAKDAIKDIKRTNGFGSTN